MAVVFWNLKGGQGKTTLSLSLALLYGYGVITNDSHSPIDRVLPDKKALKIPQDEKVPIVKKGQKVIYDFGGYPDNRIIEVIKKAEYIVIPIIYKSPFDMQMTIDSIKEVQVYNKNIIVIANATKKGDFERVKSTIGEFSQYPVLEVKESTVFIKSLEKSKSIKELMESSRLFEYHYRKPLKQVEAIYKLIRD